MSGIELKQLTENTLAIKWKEVRFLLSPAKGGYLDGHWKLTWRKEDGQYDSCFYGSKAIALTRALERIAIAIASE